MDKIQKHLVPAAIAATVALIGTAAIILMDFGPQSQTQGSALNMVTAAAADRAGATAAPTLPR
jgi:hypothetical protein